MKEQLSIEEKAKAYDKALVIARSRYSTETEESVRICLELMFPELMESKDEKIRKWLIDTIKSVPNDSIEWDVIDKSSVLAWLEKQDGHAKFINGIQVGDKVTRNQDGMLVNLSQLKRIAKPNETKQGEKKPMTEKFEHELAEICNQLLSEIDSEWMNNEILDCIGTSVWLNLCDETAKRYKDGLLKLAKQGEQKPAEWSVEEQQIIKDAASFILSCVNTAETKKEEERLEELADKIQDLKPHNRWKPSEEQIGTLKEAIIYVESCESNFKGNGHILETLLEQLKKLKE